MFIRIMIFMASSIGATMAIACPVSDGSAPPDSSVLSISATSMEVSNEKNRLSVLTLGTIKNPANACFDDVVVEVRYFDSNNKHVDTIVQPLFGMVIPAEKDISFRVLDQAAKPKESYSTQTIRVLNAEPRFTKQSRNKSTADIFKEVLISWGPILLLIAVWFYFMSTMRGKKSPQERILVMMEKQVASSDAQTRELARIAIAIERMNGEQHDAKI